MSGVRRVTGGERPVPTKKRKAERAEARAAEKSRGQGNGGPGPRVPVARPPDGGVALGPPAGTAIAVPVTGTEPRVVDGLVLPPLDPDLYINRELSWLEFNRRVLDEAADPTTPLLERVKFAAIFGENLDGWTMIRLAGVKRKLAAGITDPGPDGRTPPAQFAAIRRSLQAILDEHAALVRRELLPALVAAGIAVVPHRDLRPDEQEALGEVFEREIFPILTPQAIDRGRPFPHVSNGSLNLIVALRSPNGSRFARVKIPATLDRFVRVPAADGSGVGDADTGTPGEVRFTWLEQLVAAHLDRLFPGNEVIAAYPFHVSRDADIEPEEEDDDDTHDLMAIMRETQTQRTFGPVVRLMVDGTLPADVRDWLVDQLHASDRDLYLVDGPLAVGDLFELVGFDRPDLKDPQFVPVTVDLAPTALAGGDADDEVAAAREVFATLRERDILLHHPYQSFATVVDFIRAASTDPNVVAIKQTLYRIGKDSPLVPALIEARDDDTQVAVLVELRARFDEENNITWAEQLERRGVHVAYGLPGLKTHCKATLVVRRERDGLRRYVHLGTGNYNASTARIYEDLGLLSAREDLGRDVSELFNAITGYARQDRYETIWVAPTQLRERFLERIAREVAAHRRDGQGYLCFKMNQLVDRTLIRALYAASREGVRIDLIVRGICCLRPGVPGWSETIRVVSIVGRFLEHSRAYYFAHGGTRAGENGAGDGDALYLGSADLMHRNLDRRVEAVFPVEDPVLRAQLRDEVLPAYLRDTVNARELRSDGSWVPVRAMDGAEPFDVQAWLASRY